jgi:hypothetical protein
MVSQGWHKDALGFFPEGGTGGGMDHLCPGRAGGQGYPFPSKKMNTALGNAIFICLAYLFGLYEIGYDIYAWRLNGFRFYITAGFLIGCPFLAAGTIYLLDQRPAFHPWEIIIGLVWIFGVAWEAWRKRIAKKNCTSRNGKNGMRSCMANKDGLWRNTILALHNPMDVSLKVDTWSSCRK